MTEIDLHFWPTPDNRMPASVGRDPLGGEADVGSEFCPPHTTGPDAKARELLFGARKA